MVRGHSVFLHSFPGGSDILCSTNTVESIIYSLVFALQLGATLVSIMFYPLSHQSPRVSLLLALSSLFKSSPGGLLVIGAVLQVLLSSFVEEEHQTWYMYFFTSALFVMIFLEKITLFRRGSNFKDSERPEMLPRHVKISEHKKTSKCSSEKVIDHSNEVRNANFRNEHSYFKSTGINVDGV